jgi:hypothetical protein
MLMSEQIEQARALWARVAKANGWYSEPFYVQVWLTPDGELQDSVSTRALTQDHVIQLTESDLDND